MSVITGFHPLGTVPAEDFMMGLYMGHSTRFSVLSAVLLLAACDRKQDQATVPDPTPPASNAVVGNSSGAVVPPRAVQPVTKPGLSSLGRIEKEELVRVTPTSQQSTALDAIRTAYSKVSPVSMPQVNMLISCEGRMKGSPIRFEEKPSLIDRANARVTADPQAGSKCMDAFLKDMVAKQASGVPPRP
jgi:hypothetical protein